MSSSISSSALRSRVRDFAAFPRSRSTAGAILQWVSKGTAVFPEIEYDKVDAIRGMDIIVVTTAETDEEARELLTQMGYAVRALRRRTMAKKA